MNLTVGGIIFLAVAWGIILSLSAFCLARVLRKKAGSPD